MKRLFLLMAIGVSGVSVNAQENNSIMLAHPGLKTPNYKAHPIPARANERFLHKAGNTERNTGVTTNYNDWFDYWDENSSSASVEYIFDVYPDSNLYDPALASGGGDGYVFSHSLGMSFDPTDDNYYSYNSTTTNGITDPTIDSLVSYQIDSFFVAGKYIRNNPSTTVVDSLIIDLIVTSNGVDSGTYLLQFPADANYATLSNDSILRFADALYTPGNSVVTPFTGEAWDSIIVLQKVRMAIPLTLGFYEDTDATTGEHDIDTQLTTPLHVPAGAKVVSCVSFKSGVAYPLGTNVSAANYYNLFSGDPGGASVWPKQSTLAGSGRGSYQDGLIAQNQDGFDAVANEFTYGGSLLMIPAVAFQQTAAQGAPVAPTGIDVPVQAFHVLYSITSDVGIKNVNNMVSSVNAYPNPATGMLNISFTLSQSAAASVTLTNMLGEIVAAKNVASANSGVATFNTAALPAGVYIYTVVANGQRSTGHVAIAH